MLYIGDHTLLTPTFLMKDKSETMKKVEISVSFICNSRYEVQKIRTYQGTEYG